MRALFFRADYCGCCNVIWDEVLEPLADAGFDIAEVDAMKSPALARRYKISSVPTTVILSGDAVCHVIRGRPDPEDLKGRLTPLG